MLTYPLRDGTFNSLSGRRIGQSVGAWPTNIQWKSGRDEHVFMYVARAKALRHGDGHASQPHSHAHQLTMRVFDRTCRERSFDKIGAVRITRPESISSPIKALCYLRATRPLPDRKI